LTSNTDPIAEALDISPMPAIIKPNLPVIDATTTVEADYEYAKRNLYDLIEQGQDALQGVLDVAKQSQQANAYVAVATMIKTVSEVAKDLLHVSKTKNDITGETQKQVTNNLFVGSTAELQRLLKRNKNGTAEQSDEEKQL
jgi:hypothetical protein